MIVVVRFCVQRTTSRKSYEPVKHGHSQVQLYKDIYIYIYYIYPLYIPVLIVRFAHQFSFLHIKLASSFAAAFDIENRIPNKLHLYRGLRIRRVIRKGRQTVEICLLIVAQTNKSIFHPTNTDTDRHA